VVTYCPRVGVLRALLAVLAPQVSAIVVVDNASPNEPPLEFLGDDIPHAPVHVCRLAENGGVARAQNQGIAMARDLRADYVLLMDQDSAPAPDLVARLLEAVEQLDDAASVGPNYHDPQLSHHAPFMRVRGLRIEFGDCGKGRPVVPVDHVISSGCLIPVPVLDRVGAMREDLFIDGVDIEWGLRAVHHGLRNYGVCAAHMQHSLGGSTFRVLGRTVARHPPLRLYYQFRNAILLYRVKWIPLRWKLANLRRLILRFALYVVCARPLGPHLRMIGLGVLHGLRGVSGPYAGREPEPSARGRRE
jgi:rhamnosyltransferase